MDGEGQQQCADILGGATLPRKMEQGESLEMRDMVWIAENVAVLRT